MIIRFKISKNWGCVKSYSYLSNNAKFIFSHTGHKGESPYIVLKEAINGVDCIQIGYDRDGLITDGETNFNSTWGNIIKDSSKDVDEFIRDFLIREGASNLINT